MPLTPGSARSLATARASSKPKYRRRSTKRRRGNRLTVIGEPRTHASTAWLRMKARRHKDTKTLRVLLRAFVTAWLHGAAGRRGRRGLTSAHYRLPNTVYLLLLLGTAACAPKPPTLPTGAGTPYPEFKSSYEQATEPCRGVKTLSASMGMSGKAGSTKLHGRIDAGFAAPDRARLEGVPPMSFGKPVFVLVAEGGKGTLVLTRQDRVLKDAPPDQIVEALAGVAL